MLSLPLILIAFAIVFLAIAAFKLLAEPVHIAWGWMGLFLLAVVEFLYRGNFFGH